MHAITFPAEERHRPSIRTKLYCLVEEAHGCEQLAQGCYAAMPFNPQPIDCKSNALRYAATLPHLVFLTLFSVSVCVCFVAFLLVHVLAVLTTTCGQIEFVYINC